jgi:O-antigen/teichoic acid export membrane protein
MIVLKRFGLYWRMRNLKKSGLRKNTDKWSSETTICDSLPDSEANIAVSTEAIDNSPKAGFLTALIRRFPMTVFWALAAQGVVSVTRILTTVTVGGRFAPEDAASGAMLGSMEQLSLYYSAFGVLMVLVAMHEGFVTTPLTVFLPKQNKENESKFSGNMLLASLTFMGVAIAIAAVWILYKYQTSQSMTPVISVIAVVVALAPLQLLREFSRRWLLANIEVRASAMFEILFSVTFLASLFALFCFAQVSAIHAFVTIAIVNVVALVAWWRCFGNRFAVSKEGAKKQLMENFRYGRWAAAENVCSGVTMFFCVWYLTGKMGPDPGGVFSACFNIMLLANPFLLGVCSLLGARAAQEFTRGGWDAMLKTLTQYGTFVLVVLLGFGLLLWVFGADLTNLLFGDKCQAWFDANTEGVNRITSTLGLAVPFLGISFVLSTAILAIGRPNDNFICAIAALAVLIGVNFAFGPSLMVAAVGFVVATLTNALLRVGCLARAYLKRDKTYVAKA